MDELLEEIDAKASVSEIVADLIQVFELEKRQITSVQQIHKLSETMLGKRVRPE